MVAVHIEATAVSKWSNEAISGGLISVEIRKKATALSMIDMG
jgi:hypothetical protein